MSRDRWLTPDTPAAGFICRRLLIPNGIDWLAIVAGALNELVFPYNFEVDGTSGVIPTSAAFFDMVDRFTFDQGEECRLIGEILCFAGSTSPSSNFQLCDGSSLLRASFPDLFAVIGAIYGAVDGAHFNVPDLRSQVIVGVGQAPGLSNYSLGAQGGEETHTLSASEVPAHTHTDTGHVHTEGIALPVIGAALLGVPIPSAIPAVGVTGIGNASLTSSGGSGSHNNLQPFISLNFFIVAL